MNRIIVKFLMYLSILFIILLIFNANFKPSLDIITAFSIALGISAGYIFIGAYVGKKLDEK